MNAALRLWGLLTLVTEREPDPELQPRPELEPELKPELKLEGKPGCTTELGLGSGVKATKSSASAPRRDRRASRKGTPSCIFCCWLEPLASAEPKGFL